jgi:hypothetical protein
MGVDHVLVHRVWTALAATAAADFAGYAAAGFGIGQRDIDAVSGTPFRRGAGGAVIFITLRVEGNRFFFLRIAGNRCRRDMLRRADDKARSVRITRGSPNRQRQQCDDRGSE